MRAASEKLSMRVIVMTSPNGVTISCRGKCLNTLHFA
ncbi:hypothetical protein RKD47_001577 [Streptomyces albogriseolus]